MPTKRKHALLTASGAHRWLRCTPSARLEETLPNSTSTYAEEGTLAHSIAELKVRKKFMEPMGTRSYNSKMKKLKADPLYNSEMETCTDDYLDYITSVTMSYPTRPYITAERRLDFSRYAPEGFGTGDCIIIGGDTLHVIDFKYGKGVVVDVEDNPQLKLYGLGAIEAYGTLYNIKEITLTIFQPRANGDTVKEWTIDHDKLIDWGVFTVRPAADAAFKGEGDYLPGDWCRFCRAKAQCRARAKINTALEDFKGVNTQSKTEGGKFPEPALLTNEEVGDVLQKAINIEKWAADLKDYALSEILTGRNISGWKAVEGRSVRKFDNTDTAFCEITKAGYDEALLYERKPLTLAKVERVLGKSKFSEIVGSHVITPPGKPTLAPESDKRKPYAPNDAASEFKDVINN